MLLSSKVRDYRSIIWLVDRRTYRAELSFFDPAEPKAGVAVCDMRDYSALAHRPARKRGVVQKYDIDHKPFTWRVDINP